MTKDQSRRNEGEMLMSGVVQFDTHPIKWFLTFAESQMHRQGDTASKDVFINSLRFKVAKQTGDSMFGIPINRLEPVTREIQRAIEREMTQRNDARSAPVRLHFWKRDPQEMEELLEVLRDDFQRRKDNHELASAEHMLSVKDLVERVGCTSAEINDLHKRGLIRPMRTLGGQRRFSQQDLENIRELIHKLRRGENLSSADGFGHENEDRRDSPAERSKIRDMTMQAVAHLYAEAIEMFPSRDHSVIKHIQSRMEWLTEDHIITMIRLARTKLDLPIYRRGRMPKHNEGSSISKKEEK